MFFMSARPSPASAPIAHAKPRTLYYGLQIYNQLECLASAYPTTFYNTLLFFF